MKRQNPGTFRMAGFSRIDCIFKIKSWAAKAKSFSFTQISRENYSICTTFKNQIIFDVQYFSTAKGGKYKIPEDFDYMEHYADGAAQGVWLRKRGEERISENKRIKLLVNASYSPFEDLMEYHESFF